MSSERQRRYYERKRAGIKLVRIEVTPDHLDALINFHLLPQWDESDPEAVERAVTDLLDAVCNADASASLGGGS